METLDRPGLLIDGQWVTETENPPIKVINPARGTIIAEVPSASKALVTKAIDGATAAFESWARMPAVTRGRILAKVAVMIREQAESLAEILTREQGKPLKEAKGEILLSADYFDWYAGEAQRAYGEIIPASVERKRLFAMRQPVGVVATITPWNFPASMIARKVSAALAAGCPVVVKPSSATPLTAIGLVRILEEAGCPAGVINLVVGSAETIAQVFLHDYRVRKISFTGSTTVGKRLMSESADTLKRVSLELGGPCAIYCLRRC